MVRSKFFGSSKSNAARKEPDVDLEPQDKGKGKGKSTSRKGKEKEVEAPLLRVLSSTRTLRSKGGIVIHSPPRSPSPTTLALPGPSNMIILDKEPIFSSMEQQNLFHRLCEFEVPSPIFPDVPTLESLNVLNAKRILEQAGFAFLFKNDPGTYPLLVREFVSSFEAVYYSTGGNAYKRERKNEFISCWKFRLGGQNWELRENELYHILSCNPNSASPEIQEPRDELWAQISVGDPCFVPPEPSTRIKDPEWKIIHRFIAEHLFVRKDGGRHVTSEDMDVMSIIFRSKAVNVPLLLSRQFERYRKATHRGRALSGGPFVTLLARHLGFDLDNLIPIPMSILTVEKMIHMHMIEANRQGWKVRSEIPNRNKARMEKRSRNAFREANPPPPPPPPTVSSPPLVPPSSSSHAFENVTLEGLANYTYTLGTYAYDYMAWNGAMMGDFYSHMGWSGYTPPPPPPPHHNPFAPQPSRRDNLSADENMRSAASDDDDDTYVDDSESEEF